MRLVGATATSLRFRTGRTGDPIPGANEIVIIPGADERVSVVVAKTDRRATWPKKTNFDIPTILEVNLLYVSINGQQNLCFVDVILPVPIEKPYTYSVPPPLVPSIQFGIRVEVQFGASKRYAAVVVGISDKAPGYLTKSIIEVIDDTPVMTARQLEFWKWMSSYYSCTIGEVMHAAMPSSYKLTSETVIYMLHYANMDPGDLSDKEFLLIEALRNQNEMTLSDAEDVLSQSSILPLIHKLFRLGLIGVKEHLSDTYRPKIRKYISLTEPYRTDPDTLHEALDMTSRSERQTQALLAYLQLAKSGAPVVQEDILKKAEVKSDVIKALVKKEIFEVEMREMNRIQLDFNDPVKPIELSPVQEDTLKDIREKWQEHRVVLLHGATGSGKTWIYKKIVEEAVLAGEQVLYLLPEIALTVQIVRRLQQTFGNRILIAHSGLNDNERVDLWKRVQEGAPVVLGVRSSIFLPFQNLSTIIIDEEHDPSYKQADPAPRYQGRDAAVYLSTQWDARVILGSATPSVESYYNTTIDKYGLCKLEERYQAMQFPELQLVDLRKHRVTTDSQFSQVLLDAIGKTLDRKEQVIIFKNRRGYAPVVRCRVCGWQAMCDRCDVAMTYHKYRNNLHCHLCGLQKRIPLSCPECASTEIALEGYGTQKIEDELKVIFPDARVKRMDYDTTRRKHAYHDLITSFEQQKVDVLVGTQMVTKGLDFDHVGLVGVVHADQQLYFPHFRSVERTFQLLVQVSGRAGRKHTAGKVIIQTYNPDHPVFADVALNDYMSFYKREIDARLQWSYPPFYHLVKITLKHKKRPTVQTAAKLLAHRLERQIGKRVLGPAEPHVARVRNQYLMDIGVKIERKPRRSEEIKNIITETIAGVHREKGLSTVRVNVDVDPG